MRSCWLLAIFMMSFFCIPTAQAGKTRTDAAVQRGEGGKVYFFVGEHYVRYDIKGDRADDGYPLAIDSSTWAGLPWTHIDTAFNVGDGKIYFFKGNKVVIFDVAKDRAEDNGAQAPLEVLGLPWSDHIDAAAYWGNGKAYFFRGGEYARYSLDSSKTDPGYPKPIDEQNWPGLPWHDGIDTVVNWGNGKAYFFRGGEYVRYDIAKDHADPGYPKPIDEQNWPGLLSGIK
jgi:hypothetical protein